MRCSTAARPCCLRKGGIHEKRFTLDSSHFLFFPTVAHSHAQRVRPEHRDLLAPAAQRQHRERDRVAGRRESRCRRRGQPARRAGRDCAAAHLDRRIGARRPAGLPAQAPADGVGGAGQSAGRAGTGAPDAGIRRLHELGAAAGQPDVVDAGTRRRHAAGHRCPRARFSGLAADVLTRKTSVSSGSPFKF